MKVGDRVRFAPTYLILRCKHKKGAYIAHTRMYAHSIGTISAISLWDNIYVRWNGERNDIVAYRPEELIPYIPEDLIPA